MQNRLEELPFAPGKLFVVDNYLEVVGIMNAISTKTSYESYVFNKLIHIALWNVDIKRCA